MILLLNKNSLFSTFGVDNFNSLDNVINSMSPSMVEYYLSDLSNENDNIYLNRKNIQNSICIGEYSLYLDYDEDIYLEIEENTLLDDFETQSLW